MNEIFTENNLMLLFRLTAAHLAADFVFRWDFWKKLKFKKKWISGWEPAKGAFAGILAYVFVGYWNSVWLLFIIFISRTLFDGLKYKRGDTVPAFILNLMGHIAVISGCWIALVSVNVKEIFVILYSIISNAKLWTLGLAYILVIWPAGVWIGKITEPWRKELGESLSQGLAKAGLWIGRIERLLILTFSLLKQLRT